VHCFVTLLIRRLAFLFAAIFALPIVAQTQPLTKAIEVRSLSLADAERGLPVVLRGVVVFVEGASAIFVQDETSTTFFRTRESALPSVGDEIEVRGPTRMGLYLPGLDYAKYRILGERPLPAGIPARYDDLVFSRFHYQRVAVTGIIRSVAALGPKKSRVRLAMGSRVLEAHVEQPPQDGAMLVDCRVQITGLAVGLINKRRQLVQPYLRVVGWDEVEVLAPARPIEEVPQISAEELLAFRVTGHGEQRVRVEGTVTAVFSPEHVFLADGPIAFSARLNPTSPLTPGDRVAIVGFPEMDRFSAAVVDAELVIRNPGAPPKPEAVNSPDKLDESHDSKLVSVTGVVRDAFKTDDGIALLLAGTVRTLQARLPAGVEAPAIGARVRISGIAQVELARSNTGFAASSGIVSMRARDAADLVVLQNPSWWTARRLANVLALLAGVIALAGLWIAILRRQVNRQTEALRRRIESEAALEERQRIAREFHDSLEQELAGVSLRLDALATRDLDEKGRNLINASRNLVSRIQTETRDLIGDLRDSTEAAGYLATALASVAARHAADRGANVRVEATATAPVLHPAIVHDLRMVARESVTNALKHGRATDITISLHVRGSQLVMSIVDNGCGFDATTAVQEKRGHFGCAGIRERCRKVGAEVTWSSALQKGTTVEVTLPLNATPATEETPPFDDAVRAPTGVSTT
jgi:signal transduction histidine kinase